MEMRISGRVNAAGIKGWVVNFREVTDRKRLEDELRHQARTDPLTGLLNRAAFSERLAAATASVDPAAPPAVLFVDVDDFKGVNDSLGHAVGDDLLVAVAGRLTGDVRAEDVVARLGGDEFAVLLAEADDERLRDVAGRLLTSLRAPVVLSGTTLSVTASVGGALGAPGDTAETLLHRADTAMYEAKRAGKDSVVAAGQRRGPRRLTAAAQPVAGSGSAARCSASVRGGRPSRAVSTRGLPTKPCARWWSSIARRHRAA